MGPASIKSDDVVAAKQANDDELLAYCDGYFAELMDNSLADGARQKRGFSAQASEAADGT